MATPTHKYLERPQLGLRYLADYMAGSKRKERSILQLSKYRPIAKVIQHAEARSTVSKFIRDGSTNAEWLEEEAFRLRERLADDDFDRHLYDSNADYIARYAGTFQNAAWPRGAQMLSPGRRGALMVHGVKITVDLSFRLRRTTRTNKIKEGAGMLRYGKGKALPEEVGAWQSAFLFGYLGDTSTDSTVEPERPLCLTIDVWTGMAHAAPTNSVSRYQNMQAACASIAEQWPNIQPPDDDAVF